MSARHRMAAADAAWLHMDRRTNLMVVNAVLWFDHPLRWDVVRALFLDRVVTPFARFRQRAVEGLPGQAPSWVDDGAFEPDRHFHRLALPAPGDRFALEAIVSDLVSAPLDRSKPLWDLYLLDGYGGGCALLVRVHHAVADGIALAQVLLSVTGPSDAGIEAPPPAASDPLHRVVAPVAGVWNASRAAVRAVRDPAVLARDGRALVKFFGPWSDPRGALKDDLVAAHRVAWSRPIPLRTVKAAAHALDATVNDVLVAAVAGAVRARVVEDGGTVANLHALVPFNLRPLDEPVPADLGNRFGLVVVELPVGEADPVARVAAVHATMEGIKHSHEGALAYGVLGVLGRMPRPVESRLVDFFSARGSMVLTNVPGPRERLEVAGVPLRGVLVWAPCSGTVGMSVSVFSYAGQVSVGFLCDAAVVEEPAQLADRVRAEVLALARQARRAPQPT